MAITISNTEQWFVLPSQRELPIAEQAAVLIRPITTSGMLRLQGVASREGEDEADIMTPEALHCIIAECVRDWRGVQDTTGAPVPFPGRHPAGVEAVIDALSVADLAELAGHLMTISVPTEIELGKSPSPMASPQSRSSISTEIEPCDSPAPHAAGPPPAATDATAASTSGDASQ
jgi:hypothetical protein